MISSGIIDTEYGIRDKCIRYALKIKLLQNTWKYCKIPHEN